MPQGAICYWTINWNWIVTSFGFQSKRNDKFIKYIINTLDNIGMGNIWKDQLIENKDLSKDATLVKSIKTRLTDISSQSLISSLTNNPGKLTFLTKIKDTHKFEEYTHFFIYKKPLYKKPALNSLKI